MISLASKKLKISSNIFLYLAYFSLAVVSSYGAALSFDVPFPAILIFIFFFFLYAVANLNKITKIGVIPLILVIRLCLFIVNALFLHAELNTVLEQIVITFLSIVVFVCFYNFGDKDNNEIKITFLIFSFFTSLQICIGLLIGTQFDKDAIVAGIGQSNYAASFLLLCIAFLLFRKLNKLEILILVFDIIVLLLTQSFGAYLALFILFLIYLKKRVNWKKKRTRKIALFILILLVLLIIIGLNTNAGKQVADKFIAKIMFLLEGNWKGFGASRLEVYLCSWNNFLNHYLFGSIYNPTTVVHGQLVVYTESERAHNFILESLVMYGIIGTVLNGIVLFLVIKRGRKLIKRYPDRYPLAVAIFIAFVHGFVEPNLFTMHFELFFWILIGALLSEKCRKIK